MDYERLELLSKKLSDARIDIRLRTASNLLFKIESGIFDKDVLSQSVCITSLQNGILDSLSLMAQRPTDLVNVNNETSILLEKLLTLINAINLIDHGRQGSAEIASKILELLYRLKTVEGVSERLLSALDSTIDKVCGIRIAESTEPIDTAALAQRAVELMVGNPIPDSSAAAGSANEVRFHGAGAILNSRLVHTGWKFPSFVLTERDERWLFDVEVAVKLGRDGAARELWAVLSDLPAPALLQKTNLLRAVLDLVGAPFSQQDVEADPLGLHALTALQWLEGLLRRCRDAFRVQLDGSLCCAIPLTTESTAAADMATGLAKEMFALRHPVLPSLPTTSPREAAGPSCPQRGPIGSLSALHPTPSFPGLAFACCAAALPLLQGSDTTVCRAVHRLLQTALPFLLEPRLESSHSDHQLLPEEQARLQHLLNRMEQLLAFHSTGFNMESFIHLMGAEDPSTELSAAAQKQHAQDTIDSLRASSCQLLLLSSALEVFRAVPVQYFIPVAENASGAEGKVSVGDLCWASLCRMAGARSSLETVIPGCTDTAERCLSVLDPDTLSSIRSCEQSLRCAQIFTQLIQNEAVHSDRMLSQLVARAEAAADLLDASCPVSAPAIQGGLVGALPILLLACCESESDLSAEVDTLLAVVVRTLSCGAEPYKSLLLQHLVAWLTCPAAVTLAEPHRRMCAVFSLTARHGRHLEPLLATPIVIQALLLDTYFTAEKDTSSAPIRSAAVEVVEALCRYLLNAGLSQEHLEPWSTVLLSLKTLEWEPESAGQSHTARCTFARQLQDFCADCTAPTVTSMFAKSLVLGMFHTDSSVRISSVLRVRRDVLGLPLPSAVDCTNESGADVTASLLSCDIFCNAAPQRLQSWKELFNSTASNTVAKKGLKARVPVSTAFTHADVRKVASIGLGELEPSLRAPALTQVLEMLESDSQLLHTADAAWVLSVAQRALQQVVALVPFTNASNSIAVSAVGMQKLTDAQCRLLIETVRLLVFFFAHFWSIRTCATFLPAVAEGQSDLDLAVLLRVLFAASSMKPTTSPGCEALVQVAPLCAQVLCSVVCSAQSWQPLHCSESDTDHLAVTHTIVPASAVEKEGQCSSHALRIPSFVLQRFHFPVPTSAVSGNEYSLSRSGGSSSGVVGRQMSVAVTGIASGGNNKLLGQVTEVAYSCQPACPTSYPPQSVVDAVVNEVTGDLVDRAHVVTVTKLFGLIVNARNHAHLREALSCTLSVCAANPSMLHVFTALQLDLTTAVSKIITTCPRTQQDHLTLASALDFLHFSFASLLAHETDIPDALQGDVTQLLRDTADALLPPMSAYFTEHFERANTYFVNLTASTSESEREHATASHAVCSAFFRLLHTLSAFLSRPTQLGGQLVGSPVVSILMHIGTSELHRANDRTVALATLENLVRYHTSGWQALCCMENPSLSSIPGPRAGTGCGAVIDSDCNPLELLIRTVRLVRTPDSMQSTSVVVSALRLLHAGLLQRMAQQETPSWSVEQSAVQWKWLVRLLYDRRSDIKVLAIEILGIVLRNTEDEGPLRSDPFIQTTDSLDPELESKTAVADSEVLLKEAAAETSWPPFELLTHIVVDSTESTALRCRSIELLVHCRTTKTGRLRPALKLGALVNAVFECLSLRDTANASSAAICPALSALHRLITSQELELTAEVLALARAMKVLPLVVEVLNVRTQNLLAVRALARVSVWDEAFVASERAGFFDSDALSLRAAASTGMVFQGGGWRALQAAQRGAEADMLRSGCAVACWLLFELDKANKSLFDECIHHSNLIHFLATSFSAVTTPTTSGVLASPHGLTFEARSITAQAELLSMLISREGTGVSVDGPTASGALHDYIGKNPSVPSNLLKKIVLVLMGFKDLGRQKSSTVEIQPKLSCISACLRLLCVMMNESLWRVQLGLGGGSPGEAGPSDPCAYLFDLLLSLRASLSAIALPGNPLEAEKVSEVGAVLSRVDLCTALFMQYSYGARLLFAEYCIEQKQNNAEVPCLLEEHVAVIGKAVEFLSTTPASSSGRNANVGVSTTPLVSRDFSAVGAVTPEAKRALQGLKDRASARKTPGPGSTPASAAKAASKVNQSTSSWATRTSQGSRWRDKSRSYAWNRDRSDASTAGTAAAMAGAVDMPSALKLQVWSALIVLSSAFPACPETVDWATELRLHQSLSKLLRFAGRHSNAALLNFPAVYSSLLGIGMGKSEYSLWCPSNGMLAAAISALCCAFIHDHEHAKQCLASTGETAAAAISSAASLTSHARTAGKSSGASQTGTATSVHFLISLGVSKGVIPVSRWLSLALAGSLLYGARSLGAPTLKSVFSQMIAISLQKSLHASHSDPDAVAPLLNTLTSFLASEEDISLITQLCRKDQGALLRSFQAAAGLVSDQGAGPAGSSKAADGTEDFKFVTFPELIQWVWGRLGSRTEVTAAVCRCLGRISIVDRGHRAIGNLLTEEALAMLCHCYQSPIDTAASADQRSSAVLVRNLATLALWNTVHFSEKAKGMVRELLARNSAGAQQLQTGLSRLLLQEHTEDEAVALVQARACIEALRDDLN